MKILNFLIPAVATAVLATPALADDCAAVKAAMLSSGRTPHTVTVTLTDSQGKKTVTRQVQTVDKKYVQTRDGKWHVMNIAIKDLDDDMSGLLTCRRTGGEIVGTQSATIYEVHIKLEGEAHDEKIWVSSNNQALKSELVSEQGRYTTEYDFIHVTPPANALPMGGK